MQDVLRSNDGGLMGEIGLDDAGQPHLDTADGEDDNVGVVMGCDG